MTIIGAGPGRALGVRLRGVGGTRDARRRAPCLRRPGGRELAHSQRPGLHLGDQRSRPHLSGVRAGLAVRRQDDLRPGGVVTSDRGGRQRRHPLRRRARGGLALRRPGDGRLVAPPRDPDAGVAHRSGRLLRRCGYRGASDARQARHHRRGRQLGRAGCRAPGEARCDGDAARPRQLALDEHVRLPHHRAAEDTERLREARGRSRGRRRRGAARDDRHPRTGREARSSASRATGSS